jgi:mono/diheme cytochrome c family protein
MKLRLIPLFASVLTLGLALGLAAPAFAKGDAARGKKIAEVNCAECHAVGRTGAGANAKSPPFRTLAQRYPLQALEESLAEGIMVGHEGPEMPLYEFEPQEIEDLMAYLKTIQVKKRK